MLSALNCYVKELNVSVEECKAHEDAEDLMTTLEGISKVSYICSAPTQLFHDLNNV